MFRITIGGVCSSAVAPSKISSGLRSNPCLVSEPLTRASWEWNQRGRFFIHDTDGVTHFILVPAVHDGKARIVTVFGTGEGQTAKVAERIEGVLTDRGHETTTVNVKEIGPDLDFNEVDAVLVGVSIHLGKQQKAVRRFAKNHREGLARKPNGFFQVSGSSGEGIEGAQRRRHATSMSSSRSRGGARTGSVSWAGRSGSRSTGSCCERWRSSSPGRISQGRIPWPTSSTPTG